MAEYVTNRVNEFRTNVGMTQEDLARKTGVSRQTIIAIEKGNYSPSVLLALKIAKLFKTSVEEVFSISYAK
ncbi:MAG: helix-turn-helix transcriptional regulator [Candidatus Pacebacteria bacterium]|nr:helix-turn-helix transcriptional regulator [Candidatus Paceibacterota bacterium]